MNHGKDPENDFLSPFSKHAQDAYPKLVALVKDCLGCSGFKHGLGLTALQILVIVGPQYRCRVFVVQCLGDELGVALTNFHE
jgi:hypothetical protein